MIRLRSTFERGRAHPLLGPLLLVVLVLLLAMVFLHIVQEGVEVAAEFGAACIAIATILGLLLGERIPIGVAAEPNASRTDRGPPRTTRAYRWTFGWSPPPAAPIPLRR